MSRTRVRFAAAVAVAGITVGACGSDADTNSAEPAAASETATAADPTEPAAIRVVSADDAASTIAAAPDDLVILDVRTQEEFDEGHIEGAVLLDFYRDDFAEALATFDPDVPYVLYCRSGNRSSGARAIMADLGFADVEDVDGGIVGWVDAGLPTVTG